MHTHDPWAARTRDWLSGLGYEIEPEPDWITEGRRPDFYCTGHGRSFWCEVKSIGPTSSDEHQFRMHDYFRRNASKIRTRGFAVAHVSLDADERDAKAALALVDDAFDLARREGCGRSIVIVPENPDYGARASFIASNAETTVLFLCCRAVDNRYGYPLSFEPEPWVQNH